MPPVGSSGKKMWSLLDHGVGKDHQSFEMIKDNSNITERMVEGSVMIVANIWPHILMNVKKKSLFTTGDVYVKEDKQTDWKSLQ